MSGDEIFEYLRGVPWWGWALGGGVVLAGFYFGTRDPEPVPVANISQADEGAERRPSSQQKLSEAEMAGKLTEMKNAFQEQQQEQAENFATILDRQGERFKQLDSQWEEKVSALTSSYQEKVSTLENQVRDVESQVKNERDQEPNGYTYKGKSYDDDEDIQESGVTHETFEEDDFSYTTDSGETLDYDEYVNQVVLGS